MGTSPEVEGNMFDKLFLGLDGKHQFDCIDKIRKHQFDCIDKIRNSKTAIRPPEPGN